MKKKNHFLKKDSTKSKNGFYYRIIIDIKIHFENDPDEFIDYKWVPLIGTNILLSSLKEVYRS